MQGNPRTIANMLNASSAYRIPPYQRAYQWDAQRWQGLAHDVYQLTAKPESDPPHWLGILLLSEEDGLNFPGDDSVRLYTVIDGQQRLTTTILWLAAVAHHAKDMGSPIALDVAKFAAVEVQEIDKQPFKVAVDGKWRVGRYAKLLETRPLQAYAYFRYLLHLGNDALSEEEPVKYKQLKPVAEAGSFEDQWNKYLATKSGQAVPRGQAVDPDALQRTTRSEMSVFALVHDPKVDESQATIFDTLNGMRTPLEPLDHVRNSLFIRLPETRAKQLYDSQWKDTEDGVRRVRMKRMAAEKMFLYDYLIARGEKRRQKQINANRGAAHFNLMTRGLDSDALEELITEDLLPAMAAWPAVVRRSNEYRLDGVHLTLPPTIQQYMDSIQDLTSNPANPIVLHFAAGWAKGEIDVAEFERALFYTEGYVARQLLARKTLSPLRSRIMEVMAKLDRSLAVDDLLAALKQHEWVDDPALWASDPVNRPIYADLGSSAVLAILRGIERDMSGDGAMFFRGGKDKGAYSVEHIYPQKHATWAQDLITWGADANKMLSLVHTIGNLAPVTKEHNSSVGNGTFDAKVKYPTRPGKAAPLAINSGWLHSAQWTETEILDRGKELITHAVARWAMP